MLRSEAEAQLSAQMCGLWNQTEAMLGVLPGQSLSVDAARHRKPRRLSLYESQNSTRLESLEGVLEVQTRLPIGSIKEAVVATGDSPLGRGPRFGIPLHLIYESPDIQLEPRRPLRWRIGLRTSADPQPGNRK
jgi:hypothetical protein